MTDVETEANGLLTYDRAVDQGGPGARGGRQQGRLLVKARRHQVTEVIPTSQEEPQTWHYTTEKPAEDWIKPDFKDSRLEAGPGRLRHRGTPGASSAREWKTDDIWIRREFTLPEGKFRDLQLSLHHDDDAEVYINGVLAAKMNGVHDGLRRDADQGRGRGGLEARQERHRGALPSVQRRPVHRRRTDRLTATGAMTGRLGYWGRLGGWGRVFSPVQLNPTSVPSIHAVSFTSMARGG